MIRVILATGEFFETNADSVVLDDALVRMERRGQSQGAFQLESIARIEFVDSFKAKLEKTQAKSPKAWARWTDDDDLRLARRFDEGATLSQLAQEFERTPGAIRSRLLKRGIASEAWFILNAGVKDHPQAVAGANPFATDAADATPERLDVGTDREGGLRPPF